jgi:hypothetical protein
LEVVVELHAVVVELLEDAEEIVVVAAGLVRKVA